MGSNIEPQQIDVMFEHVLLEKCPSITELRKIGDNFCIRPLQSDDFENGFFDVLEELTTTVGKVTETEFKSQFNKMKSSNGTYYPTVIVDKSTGDSFLIASILLRILNIGLLFLFFLFLFFLVRL